MMERPAQTLPVACPMSGSFNYGEIYSAIPLEFVILSAAKNP